MCLVRTLDIKAQIASAKVLIMFGMHSALHKKITPVIGELVALLN